MKLAIGAFVLATLVPSFADAHLFHRMYEPPENQLTRDTRLLQLILDDPAERFDLARQVWDGTTRVRVKPGGFRKWLVRPGEPGMVFKGDYQVHRWSGSLKAEAARIDQRHGTMLATRIDAGLAQRNRDQVKTALREMYVVLLGELLEAVWTRLDDVETVERLYPFVLRYYAVNLQGHLNMRDPGAAAAAEATLAALARALGDSETGAPPAPEAFARQRARLVRVLTESRARS
ncbi:MAG: hypothetical protein FJZ38_13740 [Candidatus Rokubacteria bacterium]|nr:hypothetical protein [Candidatus Rokubacteria bacterium]